ncbi:ethanolamine ammonia-lyase subunit EutC [Terriglobus saanensis]|uniref:Ethanolamine ammonia-lyase small subunit n=1 Tax=Terriglobus saanensis (strain ATCC BAA-1853 / DSM 23119 / SP1PR4) TaxID=401053 RepID=E8UZT7_TERSS|nr:ethanolamine ammonia-lyase subunit EutC [Terriglobus saanensis]ADV81014.1 Ethanolamine ammonia-lyase [Terriglobus saanensis SP1PR4]
MKDELASPDPWQHLSQWTSARIAMGRVGSSQPTQAVLDFTMDHATARDAIHTPLDVDRLVRKLQAADFSSLRAWSKACNRSEYLRRPDRGRSLDPACIEALKPSTTPGTHLLTVVIADGLSSLAPASHALPLLRHLRDGLIGWTLDRVVVATQARVALGDEIGEIRGAEAVLLLIGERPGLKSPDSLGAYLTYHPRVGRTDAERNCISNIHPEGLSYQNAVFKLLYLLAGARLQGGTGVSLKDSSDLLGLERG